MTIQTALPATFDRKSLFDGGTIALGMLLLPFARRLRRKARRLRPLSLCIALLFSIAVIGSIAGCGTGSGFFGESQHTYTIDVIGTATGTGAIVLQHAATVTLTVE